MQDDLGNTFEDWSFPPFGPGLMLEGSLNLSVLYRVPFVDSKIEVYKWLRALAELRPLVQIASKILPSGSVAYGLFICTF